MGKKRTFKTCTSIVFDLLGFRINLFIYMGEMQNKEYLKHALALYLTY